MTTVASDEYVSIPKAAKLTGIGEWRIRYWLENDENFPRGERAGRVVLKPSAVVAYFRRLGEVKEIVPPPEGSQGEYDENTGAGGEEE